MEQIDFLEAEAKMLLENIERVREYQKDPDNQRWRQSHSLVVGELKHRCVALKQRLTIVNNFITSDLWNYDNK